MKPSNCLLGFLFVVGCAPLERPPVSAEPPLPLPSPPPEAPPPLATAPEAPVVAPAKPANSDRARQTWDRDPFRDHPFTLDDATKGLAGSGPLVAEIATSMGAMSCELYDQKAPATVANFVGLARGTRPWADPKTGVWSARPAYDGTPFHRVIRGFMIQGGDPVGTGTGQPGYVFDDEIWSGAKHDRAGLLCMANRGPNTNGSQFFITDAAASQLDGNYTIFGICQPVSVVHAIASVKVNGSSPDTPVMIEGVTIARKNP